MDIHTKYDIGDEVWVLHSGKAIHRKITDISARVYKSYFVNKPMVIYHIDGLSACYDEDETFSTKEELIASL